MTRRRKTLLVALALVLLAVGSFAWYRHATAVDRQVNALLAEVRTEEPALVDRWLIKIGLGKDRRTARRVYEVVEDLAKLGPPAVPALIRALQDRDIMVQLVAAEALGDLGDARGVEPLIVVLKDDDQIVRCRAARALGELGDARAVEPLAGVLKGEFAFVRQSAADALGKLGDDRAVKPLEKLLGDEDAAVREAAAKALEQLRKLSEGKPFGGAQGRPFDGAQDKP